MKSGAKLKRFFRILEIVENHPKPTPTLILERLKDDGFTISKRTLERCLAELRDEFFIEIKFDRVLRTYKIVDDLDGYTEQLIGFFKLSYQVEALSSSIGQKDSLQKHINYDFEQIIKGTEYIKPILEAIQSQSKIQILHKGFRSEKPIKRIVDPYLLKEYKGRWYLMGRLNQNSNQDTYLSFGFDRIKQLEVLKEKFKSKIENPKQFYEDVIGVSGWENKKQKIVIEFTAQQGNYIKSLPLHASQIITEDSPERLIIELHLKPNFEFYQTLLSYGSTCKVISPPSVKKYLLVELQKSIANYEN